MELFLKIFNKNSKKEVEQTTTPVTAPIIEKTQVIDKTEKITPVNPNKEIYRDMCKAFINVKNFRKAIDDSDVAAIDDCLNSCEVFESSFNQLLVSDKLNRLLAENSIKTNFSIKFPTMDWEYYYSNTETVIYDAVAKSLMETVSARKNLLLDAKNTIATTKKMIEDLQLVNIEVSNKPQPKCSVEEADCLPFSNVTKKTSRKNLGNFVAIDVETTGLYPSKSEIVEIAAIRFRDFKPIEAFHTLCSTKKGLSEEAKRINKITEEMIVDKPLFGCVAKSLLDFIGKDNLVAHNLDFDLRFIVKHGVEVFKENRKYYCTLELAQKSLKVAKEKWDKEVDGYVWDCSKPFDVLNYKLDTLCRYYKIHLPETHRALNDCLAAGFLFEALVKARE